MQKRFAIFLILAATILFGWSFVMEKYFVTKPPNVPENLSASPSSVAPSSSPAVPVTSTAPRPASPDTAQPAASVPQVAAREIKIKAPFWKGTLSNQGGVLTEWTMTNFTDGEAIDKNKGGVKLISPELN